MHAHKVSMAPSIGRGRHRQAAARRANELKNRRTDTSLRNPEKPIDLLVVNNARHKDTCLIGA
jgi:hypothetical protein